MRIAFQLMLAAILLCTGALAADLAGQGGNPPEVLDQVIFQDFESPLNWNGANPPSGWTISDNGAADGTWDSYDWSKYAAWGGSTARVSGGSGNRYNNDWLVSPSANFSSASACTLFYRHYYDDYATQSADSALVLLSNDGGSTWGDTVFVYTGSDFGGDTAPDSEYFNISAFAAGHSAVKVAFQYVKRQAVLVGSWRIDDVTFRADGSSIMSQDFESSWGPNGDNPPSGWAINDINIVRWDDNDWHQANISGWGNIAYVFWSPVEQQNEILASPAMDFTDSTFYIRLTLKQWYDNQFSNRDTAFILGSTNGGSSWAETLAVYNGSDHGSSSTPAYDTLELVSWANNRDNVRIGFKYVGNNDGKWYVDSVGVERIDMLPRDVTVTAISAPPDPSIVGYRWPVTALVENIGLNPMSFQVVFDIADTNGTTVYSDTQWVSNLASLDQATVNFTLWQPGEPQTHYMTCLIRSVTDLNHSNDTLTGEIYTFDHNGSGGPVEGWSFADNITGDGPQYDWIEISSTGTPISFTDSDNGNSGMIDMGIDFSYFGAVYDRISISIDGWLSFQDSIGADNSQSPIPDLDGPPAMIAPLWADLHLRTGYIYYFHDAVSNQFIVQYDSVEFAPTSGSDIGMEIIFDSDDNSIRIQYKYLHGEIEPDVTIGIENQAEDIGLPFNNNGQFGQAAMPGLAVTYTFLPPHDVSAMSITSPSIFLQNGSTYDIQADFRNVGANTETFTVTAFDNFGYANTQTVTGLPSLDIASVTFPGWTISGACSTYVLNVFTDLAGDMNRTNDTASLALEAINPANVECSLDGGIPAQLEFYYPDTVLANQFSAPYAGAAVSAIVFKFSSDDYYPDWPDDHQDSVWAYIFLDENDDDLPDLAPAFARKVLAAKSGWTVWNVACETTFTLTCQDFWAGWSNVDTLGVEAITIDLGFGHPYQKWIRQAGAWELCTSWPGDYMIRAYIDGDTATAPNVTLGDTYFEGAAPPDGADTVSTSIQNTGTGCDLRYKVRVNQTATELSAGAELLPGNSPGTLAHGGPDAYGHTWTDSDEPGGPDFFWIDITSIGTEIAWDQGNADDGFTDPIPMGMTFNYYGINYNSVVIATNGWVSFTRALDAFAFSENFAIPFNDELNTLLAVDWDNLDGGSSGHCYYYHDPAANAFIISWVNWGHSPGR